MEQPKLLQRAVNDALKAHGVACLLAIVAVAVVPSWLRWCGFTAVGLTFMTSVIYPFVEDWKPRSRVQGNGKAVFITGCDSGFGNRLAQRLDDLGLTVFAGCLFPEGDGAKALKKTSSSRLHIVGLDVTSDESVEKAYQYVQQKLKDNKFWAVVNNAGLNGGGEVVWTSVSTIQRIMDVNAFGVVRVTKAFLPLICEHKGRIVAVASAAGRYTYQGLVPYCMSKQAVMNFCDGLRLELYRFGIKVVTVEPWMYKTPFTNESAIKDYVTREFSNAPQDVKKLFSPDYLQRFIHVVHKFLTYSISDKPEQVVDCLEEATLAVQPKYSYDPGTLYLRLTHWILLRLAKPFADYVFHREFGTRP